MTVLEGLLGEHAILQSLIAQLASDLVTPTDEPRLKARVSLLEPALLSHARLEEELLLQPLDDLLAAQGPVEVIRAEHQDIDSLLRTLLDHDHREVEQGFRKVLHAPGLSETQAALSDLVALVADHFSKEERILFPLAKATLAGRELRRLGSEWAQRRGIHLAPEYSKNPNQVG